MNKLLVVFLISICSQSLLANISITDLNGIWKSGCIQSQIGILEGYVVETYEINKKSKLSFTRTWFQSNKCSGKAFKTQTYKGTINLGSVYYPKGIISVPQITYKAIFKFNDKSVQKGLIWIDQDKSNIRIGRGLSNGAQSTMLSLTKYYK